MDIRIKKNIIKRLNIIKGQVEGLKDMIENDKYCIDVLNQSLAAQKALEGVDSLLLENHLGTCLKQSLKNKNKSQKAIKEVVEVFRKAKK
ncbi:MAG: metal-sensitive transcriptional regulator [Patescibacteria group bacterium]